MMPEISQLRGVGPARLKALEEAGIRTVRDLVTFLPRDYRDLVSIVPLAELRPGQSAAVRARVTGKPRAHYTRGLHITRAMVTDDSAVREVVWYNQPWLAPTLTQGRELLLYGRVEWYKSALRLIAPSIEKEEGIVPVYKTLPGVPPALLRDLIRQALKMMGDGWEADLPEEILERFHLMPRREAWTCAHFPGTAQQLSLARRRIAFEDLLTWQMALSHFSESRRQRPPRTIDDACVERFWSALPFPPTGAQRRVLADIVSDLRSPRAMARMVQGDVGCGKTAIAFAAIYAVFCCGLQCAMMAPTEVLARQHFQSARELLGPLGCRVGLLTGSLTQKQHGEARAHIASGEWDVVVGTHALITDNVIYNRLGLVVTDEQHRFGVRQRTLLGQKGDQTDVLVMSATPIPRSLTLVLYGDLDLSVVDELPPGRTPVATRIVPADRREGLYGFLRQEIDKGRQVYVVCPLVEESEAVDALAAQQVYRTLRDGPLQGYGVALVHGRMKAKEKDAILEDFRAGRIQVLVSTTVIEVGVNVPNATIMVIENAERFGLAQLHQLRGRVGRGSFASWCFLMAEPSERLRFLTHTSDGFLVASKDLEIRGPGELFGTRQSGALAEGLSLYGSDANMLAQTHRLARTLLSEPDSPAARAVLQLAEARYGAEKQNLAMN